VTGVQLWFRVVTDVVLGVLLLIDLAVVARRPHVPSLRESAAWVGFYVVLALMFAGALVVVEGPAEAGAFTAGWLTEYSLSVDNLFVFVIIMSRFSVPRELQQKVLLIGILLSLVLRGGFILGGVELIAHFSWVFYFFGAYLVYTAYGLARSARGHSSDHELAARDGAVRDNFVVRGLKWLLPLQDEYDGGRLAILPPDAGPRRLGRIRHRLTPMVLVFAAIGTTDLLFALDSIPAIFGLTRDPFIVFTATVFALMGLRQLYFLLGGLMDRLVYLSGGLCAVLGFIGVKLVLDALHENSLPFLYGGEPVPWAVEVPIWVSLLFIVATLAVTTVLSLRASGRHGGSAGLEAVGGPAGGARRPGAKQGHDRLSGSTRRSA
jgi:tellurite resistance protein TerC